MTEPPSSLDELRLLAAAIAAGEKLKPSDLDRMARLAATGAETLRNERAAQAAALVARLTSALAGFPSLAGEPLSANFEVTEEQVAALERLAAISRAEEDRLAAEKQAIIAALEPFDYEVVTQHTLTAEASRAALEKSRAEAKARLLQTTEVTEFLKEVDEPLAPSSDSLAVEPADMEAPFNATKAALSSLTEPLTGVDELQISSLDQLPVEPAVLNAPGVTTDDALSSPAETLNGVEELQTNPLDRLRVKPNFLDAPVTTDSELSALTEPLERGNEHRTSPLNPPVENADQDVLAIADEAAPSLLTEFSKEVDQPPSNPLDTSPIDPIETTATSPIPAMEPGSGAAGGEQSNSVNSLSPAAAPSGELDRAATWEALRSGRLGLAEALIEVGSLGDTVPLLSSAVVLAALSLVADGNGEVDDRAREAAVQTLDAMETDDLSSEASFVAFVLLLPATTTLALLAPGGDLAGLLAGLARQASETTDAHQLRGLRQIAATVERALAVLGTALASGHEMLASLVTEEDWRKEFARYAEHTEAWLSAQSTSQNRFAAATNVWHEMLRAEAPLGRPLRIVTQNLISRAAEVRALVERPNLEAMIRKVEVEVRGSVAVRRKPIEGPSLRELQTLAEEAVQQMRAWLALLDRKPSGMSAARAKPIADLRTNLRSQIGEVQLELDRLTGASAAAVPIARGALKRLSELLEGRTPVRGAASVDELLGRDLISVTSVSFSPAWARERPLPSKLLKELERLAARTAPTFVTAAQARIKTGDYIGAELAIMSAGEADDIDTLRHGLNNAVMAAKAVQTTELEKTRIAVEEAERKGQLETGLAQELTERLAKARSAIGTALIAETPAALADGKQEVARADALLRDAADAVRQRITLRLQQLEPSLDKADRAHIDRLLRDGHFAVAEDLVERLEEGELLDARQPVSVEYRFDGFFPGHADALATWLRGRPSAMRQIGHRDLLPPDALMPVGQSSYPDDLPALAEAWTLCATQGGNALRDYMLRLLSGVGFTDPEFIDYAAPAQKVSEVAFRVRARPLRDRATAVLPEFGSAANGNYSILCLWNKRDAEDVSQALARHLVGGNPTIVLFFAPLDLEQRRRLAALARSDRLRSTIVLDEVLTLHLAMLNEGRLPTFFACALPFTDIRPWADTGTPPPEMFFGRQRELHAVEAREGDFTHLIYGGRQLGKTAVLRQVERSAAEAADTIVRYIGIAQIGVTQPPEDLWLLLAEELQRAGMPIDVRLTGSTRARVFRTAVLDWLEKKNTRRILLLLDEADEFFVKDRANKFPVTEALRTLTMECDRRFKPVFAGLRNVQKLARDPNSPLAHLGTPLVVGPLIRGQERQQAEELVRWPFAALGYRMDDAVVSRILAFANYYPSLIQVVCQRLLRVLRQRHSGGQPPWPVEMTDVEAVLEMPQVRGDAFERFRITLELDPRYNLMTLLVARFSIDEPELLARGIDKTLLRELAAGAWPAGFPPDFGDDAFDALLDEMVGLGLLRAVEGTHYALRSANLAHLIGNQGVIKLQIDAFLVRPPPAETDPLETRHMIDGRPSLLTARQEGHLLAAGSGVLILAGMNLAGISSWQKAVQKACAIAHHQHFPVRIEVTPSSPNHDRFREGLDRLAQRRAVDGLVIYIVPPTATWDGDWVKTAQQRLAEQGRNNAPVRVMFIADAQRAWDWAGDRSRRQMLDIGDSHVRIVELTAGPWSRAALDLWLAMDNDMGMAPDPVLAATGGWDQLIVKLAKMPDRHGSQGPEGLAKRLLDPDKTGDPLSDLAPLPDVLATFRAMSDVEESRGATDIVDAQLIAAFAETEAEVVSRALTWGELVGAISHDAHGLVLNPVLKLALPRLAAPLVA
jgi:hypothetical protein